MALHPLIGHHEARRRLAAAFKAGRLPQVILVTGPAGIGKQRLGLWLGQLLLCERPGAEPCGACRGCRRVLELSHPDLHWFVPIPRLKAGDSDRQVEEAAELLAEAMAARREEPAYQAADGMASHPLASAKLLLRRAALTPVEGARKVFILGEADRLVPQESSPEAANALLKLLEEPPSDTWLVLTTTEPERVLPTIRSRAVPLRLARLPEAELSRLRVPGGEKVAKVAQEARALLESIKSGRVGRFERSLKQAPWSARGGFTELLDALAAELAARAKESPDREGTERLTTALEQVHAARSEAQGNVNPQLLLASLSRELAEVL
jgi:DNA polymerase-3 subunit delta'